MQGAKRTAWADPSEFSVGLSFGKEAFLSFFLFR